MNGNAKLVITIIAAIVMIIGGGFGILSGYVTNQTFTEFKEHNASQVEMLNKKLDRVVQQLDNIDEKLYDLKLEKNNR